MNDSGSIETSGIIARGKHILTRLRPRMPARFQSGPDTNEFHPAVFAEPKKEMTGNPGVDFLSAVSAGEATYEFNATDWSEWLSKNVDIFMKAPKEIKRNAGVLMSDFVAGVNDTYDDHRRRGNDFPKRPEITIDLFQETASADPDDCNISIGKKYLMKFAQLPLDTPTTHYSPFADTETVLAYDTPRQHLRSAGVEEADHSQYQQTHPDEERTFEQIPPEHMTLARYDAKPLELRALREELADAIRTGYPQRAIEVLQARIKRAEEFLGAQKES